MWRGVEIIRTSRCLPCQVKRWTPIAIWITSSRKETALLLKILASHLCETPPHSPSPHHTTIPPCAGPAKEQEESLEPVEEDNADTIVVECEISDRGESSDDSEDEDYAEEEPLPVAKRRRVRFSNSIRYAPDGLQEFPMSPADTLENQSRGSPSDVACIHEEMPVSGVLTLKEVDGTVRYSLTFSQVLMPHALRQNNDTRSSASPSVQRRGGAFRGRPKFTDNDNKNIIKMREEDGKSWDEIADVISGSTKGSIQVHYSTKLKDREGMPKRVSKRRRVE
jgi:hypothetical protein